MKLFLIYLILINAAGFFFMLVDKLKAKYKKWRIPEASLMGLALAGGSIGVWGGIYAFRHKTLHPKFTIGVPVIFALQVTLGVVLFAISSR